jgi:hypothetical protein
MRARHIALIVFIRLSTAATAAEAPSLPALDPVALKLLTTLLLQLVGKQA